MPSPQGARIGRILRDMTIDGIQSYSPRMAELTVASWRGAIDTARSQTNPRRKPLIELMESVIFDGHLFSVMDKRLKAITNKSVLFMPTEKGGSVNERIQPDVCESLWFYDLRSQMMSALPFGFNLSEIIPEKGKLSKSVAAPRSNVLLDYNFLAQHYTTTEPQQGRGIDYLNDPYYSQFLIETKAPFDLGLLSIGSLYVILKRMSLGDWAEFNQLFGIPLRIGKYNPFDDYSRQKLNDALKNMGSASHITIPEGSSIEIKDANQSGKADTFKEALQFCNEEISKLFLGNTMTTDNGSSRSQSETHEKQQDSIHVADMIWMEHQLNYVLKPKLLSLGYPVEKGAFKYPETSTISLIDRIKIDIELHKVMPIPMEYWRKTYGIEEASPEELAEWMEKQNSKSYSPGNPANDPEEEEDNTDPKKKQDQPKPTKKAQPEKPKPIKPSNQMATPNETLSNWYKGFSFTPAADWPVSQANKELDKIWSRITKDLHSGKIKPGGYDPKLHQWIREELKSAITSGMGDKYSQEKYKDYQKAIESNVHVFSGFKTYQELRAATDMLLDDNGKIRPFAEFKELILQVKDLYNVTYLQAEYNQAIAASQMGAKWIDIESQAEEMPMLKFETAGDSRVRDDHQILDGIILPVTDSAWDHIYPPLDWNCRCDVTQLIEGEQSKLPSNMPKVKEQFAVHWGKEKILFPDNHPYYKLRKEDEDMNDFLRKLPEE